MGSDGPHLGSDPFFQAVKNRRSISSISNTSPVPDSKIVEIVQTAVKHVPSAFNCQGGRAVVVLGDEHRKLWKNVEDLYLPACSPQRAEVQKKKLDGFVGGYGTVLFFEDQAVVEASEKRNPAVKESFSTWSENSTGMLQYVVWTALELEGLGASLQHHADYLTSIRSSITDQFSLPSSWKSTALMPFGKPIAPPGQKTFEPIEDRVKVFGAKA